MDNNAEQPVEYEVCKNVYFVDCKLYPSRSNLIHEVNMWLKKQNKILTDDERKLWIIAQLSLYQDVFFDFLNEIGFRLETARYRTYYLYANKADAILD